MKYRLTRPAVHDLAEIGRYTRKHWGRQQTTRYRQALTTRLKWLCRNKPLWHERPEIHEGIYTYPEQSHIIVFAEYEGGLEVLRVLHRRMDPARHVGSDQ